jgi:hypothetical protein
MLTFFTLASAVVALYVPYKFLDPVPVPAPAAIYFSASSIGIPNFSAKFLNSRLTTASLLMTVSS